MLKRTKSPAPRDHQLIKLPSWDFMSKSPVHVGFFADLILCTIVQATVGTVSPCAQEPGYAQKTLFCNGHPPPLTLPICLAPLLHRRLSPGDRKRERVGGRERGEEGGKEGKGYINVPFKLEFYVLIPCTLTNCRFLYSLLSVAKRNFSGD